ncbi:helix-turn-helix domain-containing protein [Mesorhizobium sp. M0088]|uniref:helix-turn-helix transcriptional regulator n=1 Tax=Mesorhizobium sp. M0088 TaxID=2956873 RepID=UPI00333A7C70
MVINIYVGTNYVCKKLGIGERNLRNMCAEGRFPKPSKIGRKLRWEQRVVDRWTPNKSCSDTFVTHDLRSGAAAFRLVKPAFQSTVHGTVYAVFQSHDGRWHVRPFHTQTVWDAGSELLELSCEDQSVQEIPFCDIAQLSSRLTNDDGDDK